MASGRLSVPKRQIVRRLRDEGFELERQNGSHMQWKHWHLRRTVTVPDRPEITGDKVKSIYDQAGWPWQDSLMLNLPKPKVVPMASLSASPIQSAQQPSADSKPVAVPQIKQVQEPKEMHVVKRPSVYAKRRDADTIELIAQDALENPSMTQTALAARWDMAGQSFSRIRQGIHGKLRPRTISMLKIVFCGVSPLTARSILKEYKQDPKSLPISVREKIEEYLPKEKVAGLLKAPEKALAIAPKLEPKPEPQRVAEQPKPVYVPKPEPSNKAVAVLRRDVDVVGYAHHSIGSAQVQVGNSSATLKELLESARQVMRSLGITKVVLPAIGEITIQRKEILV